MRREKRKLAPLNGVDPNYSALSPPSPLRGLRRGSLHSTLCCERRLVVGEGFEPSKAMPADLQSALVVHLSTPPKLRGAAYCRITNSVSREKRQKAISRLLSRVLQPSYRCRQIAILIGPRTREPFRSFITPTIVQLICIHALGIGT